jgi:hypothetical protein
MKIEPTKAAKKAPQRGRCPSHCTAAAVPTSTGAIAAGNVRGRAAITHILISDPHRSPDFHRQPQALLARVAR